MTPTLYRLVTLAEAKEHLGVLVNDDDVRIDRLVLDVSQIIMDYIGGSSAALNGWTDTSGAPLVDANGNPSRIGAVGTLDSAGNFTLTLDSNGDPIDEGVSSVPGPVRNATLLAIANLDDDREGTRNALSPGVESLLARFRDPPVA
jgi:hypothetical protein